MKESVDDVMREFAHFLAASWRTASAIASLMEKVESTEFMSDWLQANWELLVETPFRELVGFGNAYLETYGEGADCNDSSSRVWNPGAFATHRVVCRSAEGSEMLDLLTGHVIDVAEIPVVFDHFASKSEGGWHEQSPPFDCVFGYQAGQEVLIRLDEVSFAAEQVGGSST